MVAVVVTGRKGGAEEEPTGREGGRWAAVARQREEGLLFGAAGIERRLEVVWQGRLGGLIAADMELPKASSPQKLSLLISYSYQ